MTSRIASPDLFPGIWRLPQLKCSRLAWAIGVRNEAGKHGDEETNWLRQRVKDTGGVAAVSVEEFSISSRHSPACIANMR